MLTENDAVDAEKVEEVAAAGTPMTDTPIPAGKGETDEPVVDNQKAAQLQEGALDANSASETNDLPQAEAKPKSDDSNAATVKAQPEAPSKPKKRKKRQPDPEMAQIVSWFAACGRCSYFFTGYRIIAGEEMLETTVAQRSKHWLTMPWNQEIVDLVHKSYGSRVDTGCYHFEGCCSECRRHFVFQSAEEAGGTATFRIELKTRTRI